MRLEASASEVHYFDHIRPLLHTWGDALLWTESELVEDLAHVWSIPVRRGTPLRPSNEPLLVASFHDAQRCPGRPLILLEHGAGQTYAHVESPSYAGSAGWKRAILILSPGPHAARLWRERYPEKAVVELGGSPRLDPWVEGGWNLRGGFSRFAEPWVEITEVGGGARAVDNSPGAEPIEKPIGLAFHWNAHYVAPEAGATYGWWRSALGTLVDEGHRFLGHGHPRAGRELSGFYEQLGIAWTASFDTLLEHCGLLCADNTSVMYEWAALNRPVLCLDAPMYRREVEHGLRFWSHAPGLSVADPEHLEGRIYEALLDPPEAKALRFAAAEEAYGGLMDGRSLERALEAIGGVL